MLINGEKYACEACVRGHRVSSCTHSDRKLLHVNKKGRPVSQCPHCRSLRKNRSQHVKCECHDKSHAKEDCPHLKELQEAQSASSSNVCCCGHGARCTCSLKKEPYLDTVPEDITSMLQQQKEKVRHSGPNANQHDSKPTVFTNGHHKPVHKFNDAHNHCGAPYRIPSRSNSHREIAQRSTDSLPLTARQPVHHESPLHSVMIAVQPTRQVRSEHNSPLLAPTSNPGLPNFPVEIPPLSPNDYSYSPFKPQSPFQSGLHLPETIPENWFTTHDEAHNNGPPAVPELAYIDWSKYGFGGTPTLDNNGMQPLFTTELGNSLVNSQAASQANSQIPSYAASVERLNQLSSSGFNTSSGEISEVEDLPSTFRPTNLRSISHASNEVSSTGATDDGESHRLSSASSYFGTPAGNMLASNMEDLDIDKFIAEQTRRPQNQPNPGLGMHSQSRTPEMKQFAVQSPQPTTQQQPTPPQSHHTTSTPPESIQGYSIESHPSPEDSITNDPQVPYSIAEAQSYAHMQGNRLHERQKVQMMQDNAILEDPMGPMWGVNAMDQYGEGQEFSLDDEREDEAWVR